MKKCICIISIVLIIGGCASVKTIVTNPRGEVYTVQSKKDALVMMEKDGVKLTVDNRGKPGIFENLMGIMLMKTEVNLSNKDGD